MILARLEKKIGCYLALLADRIRAAWWRLRGANLGDKSRIGGNCKIIRPWRLHAGRRMQFEQGIFIKITSEQASIKLGDEVFVGYGAEMDISNSLTLGNHVLIAPGCFITDHYHRIGAHDLVAAQGCESAPVVIDDDVWLGANTVILAGIRIGEGAVVGAGAVVTHDVAPMTIVVGVPAKPIGKRM